MMKRIMTLFLAVILLFQTEVGTLYAMEPLPVQQPGTDVTEGAEDSGQEDTPSGEEIPEEPSARTGAENPAEYTITFQFNGGMTEGSTETSSQIIVTEGEEAASVAARVPVPVRTGYKLENWKDEAGIVYDFTRPESLPEITSDLTLNACWTAIAYTIHFDANGGTGEMADQTIWYDEDQNLTACQFTRPGYAFEGWKWEEMNITYQDENPVKNLTDQDGAVITLKAIWKVGNYTVRFDANGGTGEMDEQEFTYTQNKALLNNKYKRTGYTFKGWNTRPDGTGISYQNKQKVKSLTEENGGVVVLYAMWEGNPYRVTYNGNGATSGSMADSSHVYGTFSSLNRNNFKRKGFLFAGWNTEKNGTGRAFSDGAQVYDLTTEKDETVTLYACWTPITYTITYYTNGGKLSSSSRKTYTADAPFVLPRPTRKGYDFDGWYKKSNFKNRIGEIKPGQTGNLVVYAKWVKCTEKAKSDSAKLTTCKATGSGKVSVQATIKKRVASSDDYYYLMYINPMNQKIYRVASKVYKKKNITFNLKTAENQGYATSTFGIAVKKSGKYKLISNTSYVKNVEKAAKNKSKYNPGRTKKGIQFSDNLQEVYNCGAKQTFLNVTVSMVCNNGTVPYVYNGKTYYFNPMDSYREIVMDCNRNNVTVTMQVMLDWTEGHTDLIASKARVRGVAPFYTWNVTTNKSREKMEAIFCYLGMVFGKKNCSVSNWVLGNEVNNPAGWNYKGGMSETAYFKAYAYGFRALYYAIRSQSSNAHIFICTDNLWNTSVKGGYSARHVIEAFNKQLNKIQKGLKWHLAYHAYSTPLTYTKFWDGLGITGDVNTPYITMKNIDVLTKYIKKNYGSSVRIILSEQGYSSTWGETNQAAALAYSYYIAACNPMIDAFIIRSYSDHPVEVAQGLKMGIYGKEAFKVFKYMDTSQTNKYTKKYLSIIGATSWKKIVPGYKFNRLRKMYRNV